jgi:hypothetical protein
MPNVFQSNNSLNRSVRLRKIIRCRRVNCEKSNIYYHIKISQFKQKMNRSLLVLVDDMTPLDFCIVYQRHKFHKFVVHVHVLP